MATVAALRSRIEEGTPVVHAVAHKLLCAYSHSLSEGRDPIAGFLILTYPSSSEQLDTPLFLFGEGVLDDILAGELDDGWQCVFPHVIGECIEAYKQRGVTKTTITNAYKQGGDPETVWPRDDEKGL